MKQAILTFKKAKIIIIELPDDLDRFIMAYGNCIGWLDKEGMCCTEQPLGEDSDESLELIGKLSELTEEQFAEIVDKDRSGYKDYDEEGICSIYPFIGAKGSFLSKLRADGYYTENPAGPIDECVISAPGSGPYEYEMAMWNRGEEKIFSPDKTWVFTIKQ